MEKCFSPESLYSGVIWMYLIPFIGLRIIRGAKGLVGSPLQSCCSKKGQQQTQSVSVKSWQSPQMEMASSLTIPAPLLMYFHNCSEPLFPPWFCVCCVLLSCHVALWRFWRNLTDCLVSTKELPLGPTKITSFPNWTNPHPSVSPHRTNARILSTLVNLHWNCFNLSTPSFLLECQKWMCCFRHGLTSEK